MQEDLSGAISPKQGVACLISYMHLGPKRGPSGRSQSPVAQLVPTNAVTSRWSKNLSSFTNCEAPVFWIESQYQRDRLPIQVCYRTHAHAHTQTQTHILSSYGFSTWTIRRVTLMQSTSFSGLFCSLFFLSSTVDLDHFCETNRPSMEPWNHGTCGLQPRAHWNYFARLGCRKDGM